MSVENEPAHIVVDAPASETLERIAPRARRH